MNRESYSALTSIIGICFSLTIGDETLCYTYDSTDNLIASVGTSVQGHNLFAYCFNNPVNMADPSGHWPREITAGIATVAAIVAGAGLLVGAPIVAIPAAGVALAALAGYTLQTAHYKEIVEYGYTS